jgi:hypothetical protein
MIHSIKKDGHRPDENVDEDFEALLSGATYHSSKLHLAEDKKDKKEATTKERDRKTFSSHIPQELSKSSECTADSEEVEYPITNPIIFQVSHEKKLAVITQALKEERKF